MAYQFHSQTSFASGALSKLYRGQINSDVYASAVKDLENVIPIPQGPLIRRPGTYFAGPAATNTANGSRLVPFYFGEGQSYVLEFFDGKIRIFTGAGPLNYSSTFETAGLRGTPFEISTTGYNIAKIHEIDFVQSADVIFITHKDVPLQKIVRTIPVSGETGYNDTTDTTWWTLSNVVLSDGPWDDMNIDNEKLLTITGTATWIEVGGLGIDTSADEFVHYGHGLRNGMTVRFKTGNDSAGVAYNFGTASYINDGGGSTSADCPFGNTGSSAPFVPNTDTYFVVNASSSAFSLSHTFAGSPISFKLSGTTEWDGVLAIEKKVILKDVAVTITASGTNSADTFVAADEAAAGSPDALLRVNLYCGSEDEKTKGVKWVWFKIKEFTNGTTITAEPQSELTLFGANGKTREWQFGILGGRYGYAGKCTIHQQRLILAASTKKPTTLWLSNTGDFENFAPDTAIGIGTGDTDGAGQTIVSEQILDNNSLNLTIDSDTIDRIYWLSEKDRLEIGTSGGPFHLYGSETSRTITPLNFTLAKASAWECADVAPVRVGDVLVYVQLGKRKIRVMTQTERGSYIAADLTKTSDHFQTQVATGLALQKQPHSVVWIVREDGKLVTLSFDDREELYGWSRQVIGGTHTEATALYGNHAKVESIAVIPEVPDDKVWMIVKRTETDDSEVRHIEFLENFFQEDRDTQRKAHFVDSGLRSADSVSDLPGSPITSHSLGHLKGRNVDILVNGGTSSQKLVDASSGNITFLATDFAGVTRVIAGLPYTSSINSLPAQKGDDGSVFPIGRIRMIRAHLRFSESLAIQVGLEDDTLEEILFRSTNVLTGTPPPLFTGIKDITLTWSSEDEGSLKVLSSGPLPMTLLNLITEYEVNIQ